jgi:dTDP-4-amino-4,6-dideoxygalactose transaminase
LLLNITLLVVEDAAQSHGAINQKNNNRKSKIKRSVAQFYPGKI